MDGPTTTKGRYADFGAIAPLSELEPLLETFGGFFYICGHTRTWTDLYVSPGVERITGYTRNDFESGAITFDQLFDPALVAEVRGEYTAQLRARGRYSVDLTINAKDGSVRWLKDSGVRLRDDGPPRIFGLCLDVSSVAWERHLRRRAESEAERFIAFKSRAVSVIAHEMRTPLNVLCGYIDLMRSEAETLKGEKLGGFVANAEQAAQQLTRIADSAAQYASTESPDAPLLNTTLLSLLRDAAALLDARRLAELDLRLNEPAFGRSIVRGDRVALASAFAEILENAAKHAGGAPIVTVDAWTCLLYTSPRPRD